jgi:hypothetical protein
MQTFCGFDSRGLLGVTAFCAEGIASHPVRPEGTVDGSASANLRSGLRTIQAFRPDDPQQRRLRVADFFKKRSGYFTRIQALRLATRQVDDPKRTAGVVIGFAFVRVGGPRLTFSSHCPSPREQTASKTDELGLPVNYADSAGGNC